MTEMYAFLASRSHSKFLSASGKMEKQIWFPRQIFKESKLCFFERC